MNAPPMSSNGEQCAVCGSRFFQTAEFRQYIDFGPGGGISADDGRQVRICLCGSPQPLPPRRAGRPDATDSLNDSLRLAWECRARLQFDHIRDELERQFAVTPELRALEERLCGLEKIMQQLAVQNPAVDQDSSGEDCPAE